MKQNRRQGLGGNGILQSTGVNASHARCFHQFEGSRSRIALIGANKNIAINRLPQLLKFNRADVLKCGHNGDSRTEKRLRFQRSRARQLADSLGVIAGGCKGTVKSTRILPLHCSCTASSVA